MKGTTIRRTFSLIRHLQKHGEARFTDLERLLFPISRATLCNLLRSLVEIGELEHHGRAFRLAPSSSTVARIIRGSFNPSARVHKTTLDQLLTDAARQCGVSLALFARFGESTVRMAGASESSDRRAVSELRFEWPLWPIHSYAQVMLAYSRESVARRCYQQWQPYFRSHPTTVLPESVDIYLLRLQQVRECGFALAEDGVNQGPSIAVPVHCSESGNVDFALASMSQWPEATPQSGRTAALQGIAATLSAQLNPGWVQRARRTVPDSSSPRLIRG
jgi:DNA-binding IclR family transcriptional regulator